MKVDLLYILIRSLLALGRGTLVLGKGVTPFFLWIQRIIEWLFKALVPPIFLLFYRTGKKIKQVFLHIASLAEDHIFHLIAHRYITHIAVIAILVLVAIPSFNVSAEESQRSSINDTLLSQLVGDQEELITDPLLETKLAASAQGMFELDVPPEVVEEDLMIALDSEAVWSTPIMSGGAVSTRSKPMEYHIAQGDTISTIAERFGVSAGTILWENKIGPYDVLKIGQSLTILPVSGVSYTIRKGDTLAKIARLYQSTAESVQEFNQGSNFAPGTRIIIPGGRPIPIVTPSRPTKIAQKPKPGAPRPASIIATPGGAMLWPTISHRINQYFSWRHTGLDIDGDTGSPLYAADDGIVEVTQYKRTGYGLMILIDHGDGTKTRYGHASKIFVEPGEAVSKGQVIALMGSTGRSTGPHLHFEIIIGGKRLNPLGYIK